MLWELLAGHRLWQGMGEAHIVHHLAAGMPIPNLPSRPGRPPMLDRICARALTINAGDRYATAADLQSDLEGVLAGMADSHERVLGRVIAVAFSEARAEREALIARALGTGRSASAPSPEWARDIDALLPTLDGDYFDVTMVDEAAAPQPREPPPPPARRGAHVSVAVTTIGLAAVGLALVVAGIKQQQLSVPASAAAVAAPAPSGRVSAAPAGELATPPAQPEREVPAVSVATAVPVVTPPRCGRAAAGRARGYPAGDERATPRGPRAWRTRSAWRGVSVRGDDDREAPARFVARDRRKRSLQMKIALVLAVALATLAGSTAVAESSPKGSEAVKLDDAQRRFQRGVELYKEGDFGGAFVEFKRAYDLVPSYKILYNLGQVSYQRHDYASALRYFRQYLGEGDEAISVDRQREVAAEITKLAPRVGSVEVQALEEGAEVFVDDVLMGTTPIGTEIVNVGRRKVELVTRGGEHATRVVDVAGGGIVRVSFPRLAPQPAAAAAPAEPAPARRSNDVVVTPWPVAAASVPVMAAPEPPPATATTVPLLVSTPPPAPQSTFPWKSWTVTGMLAAGAATTGVMAVVSKRELDAQLSKFPLDDVEVDYYNRRTRGFALATDGLLIGTSIMTAVSFYLTFKSR